MNVSVIIPTHNRSEQLKLCVESLLKQDMVPEIIIVIDGKHSKTEAYLKTLSKINRNVKYYLQSHSGPAAARNLAVKKARGKIIVFLDDDCIVDKRWIRNILSAHSHNKNFSSIVGKIIPKRKDAVSLYCNQFEITQKLKSGDILKPNLVNNVSYKRESIRNIYFNEKLRTAEDVDFNYRLFLKGNNALYKDNIVVKHAYRERIRDFFKQQYSFGVGRAFLFLHEKDYPEDRTLLYWIKLFLTPFLSPISMLIKSIARKRKNWFMYLYLSILQQLSYWPGFIVGLFKYWHK